MKPSTGCPGERIDTAGQMTVKVPDIETTSSQIWKGSRGRLRQAASAAGQVNVEKKSKLFC
jgi:hypothetical protein